MKLFSTLQGHSDSRELLHSFCFSTSCSDDSPSSDAAKDAKSPSGPSGQETSTAVGQSPRKKVQKATWHPLQRLGLGLSTEQLVLEQELQGQSSGKALAVSETSNTRASPQDWPLLVALLRTVTSVIALQVHHEPHNHLKTDLTMFMY